jgi:hypothetical protein
MSDTLPTELSPCWHVAPQRVTTLTLAEIRRDVDWSGELVSSAAPSVSDPTHAEPHPTDATVLVRQAEQPPAPAPETPATPTTAHPVSTTASLEPSLSVDYQPAPPTVEAPSESPSESLPENGPTRAAELVLENESLQLTQELSKSGEASNLEVAPESPEILAHRQATPESLAPTVDQECKAVGSLEDQPIELSAASEEEHITERAQTSATEPPKSAAVETVATDPESAPVVKNPVPPELESARPPEHHRPQAEATSLEATAANSPPTINTTADAVTPTAITADAETTSETTSETTADERGTSESGITAVTHLASHETSPGPQAISADNLPSTSRVSNSPSSEKQNSRGAPSCPPRSEEASSVPVTRKQVPHSLHDRDRSLSSRTASDFEGSPELTLMSIRARTFEPGDYDSLLGYVEQLENVIYQLNVEMGRLRSDSPATTNERELLARRLVELSLENSELKQATQTNPIPFSEDRS